MKTQTYDAIVIGTGLGGSTFAYGLAKRGMRVCVIEQGQFLKPGNDPTPVHMSRFNGSGQVGGLTKFYGAAMPRFREIDFKATEMESGVSPAWPFSYADLEPWYCEAEQLYKVHGSSANDPSEPWRSKGWRYHPILHQGPMLKLALRLALKAGASVSWIPKALDYDPADGGKCVLCRDCDGYYCPRDAKMDSEIAALRPALATGNVTVLTGTRALAVETAARGKRIDGVRVSQDGGNYFKDFKIHAGLVAVCAGHVETPLLLWRSRTTRHPFGLGNSSGTLGRFMGGHTAGWFYPLALGVQREPFHMKTLQINQFYNSMPGWKWPGGIIQAAGHVESQSRRLKVIENLLLDNSFQFFAMTEGLPHRNSGFGLTDNGAVPLLPPVQNRKTFAKLRSLALDLFRTAGYFTYASPRTIDNWHCVGTARMGNDPRTSIVDSNCQAHDVEGLYVVDASALPSASAMNTGLTIAAVALRAAAQVKGNL